MEASRAIPAETAEVSAPVIHLVQPLGAEAVANVVEIKPKTLEDYEAERQRIFAENELRQPPRSKLLAPAKGRPGYSIWQRIS